LEKSIESIIFGKVMKLITFLFFSCFVLKTYGQPREGVVYQYPDGSYSAGVQSENFQFIAAQSTQNKTNWCWAACVQMVLRYQNLDVRQDVIVTKAYGSTVNQPADCGVIANAANNWNIGGKTIRTYQQSSANGPQLVDDLARKYPVIIGLNIPGQNIGHAYVLTAIFYTRNAQNQIVPWKVVLRDPWPNNPSRLELPWDNFRSRINCIVRATF
jgi:hypothetical protein